MYKEVIGKYKNATNTYSTIKQLENNEQNGNSKSVPIKNYFKYKWTKFSNQNTWRVTQCIKQQYPAIWCLQDILSVLKIHRLKVKRWKKIFYTNGKQKKAGTAMLTSGKNRPEAINTNKR